jgi:hypothetical protein
LLFSSKLMVAADRQNRSAAELRVGIVSIQGAVQPHAAAVTRAGAAWVPIRRARDFDGLDALILPGGKSTTISKGLERVGLYEALEAFAQRARDDLPPGTHPGRPGSRRTAGTRPKSDSRRSGRAGLHSPKAEAIAARRIHAFCPTRRYRLALLIMGKRSRFLGNVR